MAVYDWINGESVLVSDEEQARRDIEWWASYRDNQSTNTDPPDNLDASIEYLVEGHIVDFSAAESSPDYLNEHEHEFNYFE